MSEPTSNESLNNHEPEPQPSDHPAAWDLVLTDINERDGMGTAKYGVRLTPFNGRNFIKDAYQEALDLTVYLRGAVYEIETLKQQLEAERANTAADTQRLDWLNEQTTDTIYLDDGRLIDVQGNNIRTALDRAMKAPDVKP